MTENQIRRIVAVSLTGLVVILFSILNLVAPIFGTIAILLLGIIWTSIIFAVYSEEE